MIKHFTMDQRRIYDAWREHKADNMTEKNYDREMAALEQIMAQMFGGGKN